MSDDGRVLQVGVGDGRDPRQSLLSGTGGTATAATERPGILLPQSRSGNGTKSCSGEAFRCQSSVVNQE